MNAPKCANCKRAMKRHTGVNKLFLNKYIVSDATVYLCARCGEEYMDEKEYERIRKKIAAIEGKGKKISAVHQVIAKAKFLVL